MQSIYKLLVTLEATLVTTSSGSTTEIEKSRTCQSHCIATAAELMLYAAHRKNFSPAQTHEYQTVRDRVLVYLLYYDRLIHYLENDNMVPSWHLSEHFPAADYNDWKKAGKEAGRLFVEYLKQHSVRLVMEQSKRAGIAHFFFSLFLLSFFY